MSAGYIVLAIFLAIIIVLFLIMIHELGHFIVAKIFHVYVYEFSIGFGPKIFSWGKKETKYVLRWIPLGGFVHIASELTDPPEGYNINDVADDRFIEQQSLWKKLLIIASGAFVNLFFAILVLTVFFTAYNAKAQDPSYWGATYQKNSAVWHALKCYHKQDASFSVDQTSVLVSFDFIYSVNKDFLPRQTEPVRLWKNKHQVPSFMETVSKVLNISQRIKKHKPQYVGITKICFNQVNKYHKVVRHGEEYPLPSPVIVNDKKNNPNWVIGISAPTRYFISRSQAYGAGWITSLQYSVSLLVGLQQFFSGHSASVQGPVGIVKTFGHELQTSALGFFQFVALFSANLFIFNVLPIPPLDGYRFWETIVEKVIGREIPERAKIAINITGVIFFVLFIIAIVTLNLL